MGHGSEVAEKPSAAAEKSAASHRISAIIIASNTSRPLRYSRIGPASHANADPFLPISTPPTSSSRSRYALDQSAIVAITDVPGRIKYVNDKFCEISKYSRDGADRPGSPDPQLRLPLQGVHPRACGGRSRTAQIWRGELRNRAKDGSLYWVDTTIVPFLDERGKPWQYMAIRYDITERKRQEQRLREQAALTTLGEMAAVVAHEVRNPLAGIRSGLQLLDVALSRSRRGPRAHRRYRRARRFAECGPRRSADVCARPRAEAAPKSIVRPA